MLIDNLVGLTLFIFLGFGVLAYLYTLFHSTQKQKEVKQMSIKKLSIYCQEHNKKVSIKNGKLKGILKEDKK